MMKVGKPFHVLEKEGFALILIGNIGSPAVCLSHLFLVTEKDFLRKSPFPTTWVCQPVFVLLMKVGKPFHVLMGIIHLISVGSPLVCLA